MRNAKMSTVPRKFVGTQLERDFPMSAMMFDGTNGTPS